MDASEAVAGDTVDLVRLQTAGRRTSSRIDPLGVLRKVEVWKADDGAWEVKKFGKAKQVRPSEINHGNIAPSVSALGVTCDYCERMAVPTFAGLRRLGFGGDRAKEGAGRALVAALGIMALRALYRCLGGSEKSGICIFRRADSVGSTGQARHHHQEEPGHGTARPGRRGRGGGVMLCLEIEYLLGVSFASTGRTRPETDFPPQPDRVFSALVASWGAMASGRMSGPRSNGSRLGRRRRSRTARTGRAIARRFTCRRTLRSPATTKSSSHKCCRRGVCASRGPAWRCGRTTAERVSP